MDNGAPDFSRRPYSAATISGAPDWTGLRLQKTSAGGLNYLLSILLSFLLCLYYNEVLGWLSCFVLRSFITRGFLHNYFLSYGFTLRTSVRLAPVNSNTTNIAGKKRHKNPCQACAGRCRLKGTTRSFAEGSFLGRGAARSLVGRRFVSVGLHVLGQGAVSSLGVAHSRSRKSLGGGSVVLSNKVLRWGSLFLVEEKQVFRWGTPIFLVEEQQGLSVVAPCSWSRRNKVFRGLLVLGRGAAWALVFWSRNKVFR